MPDVPDSTHIAKQHSSSSPKMSSIKEDHTSPTGKASSPYETAPSTPNATTKTSKGKPEPASDSLLGGLFEDIPPKRAPTPLHRPLAPKAKFFKRDSSSNSGGSSSPSPPSGDAATDNEEQEQSTDEALAAELADDEREEESKKDKKLAKTKKTRKQGKPKAEEAAKKSTTDDTSGEQQPPSTPPLQTDLPVATPGAPKGPSKMMMGRGVIPDFMGLDRPVLDEDGGYFTPVSYRGPEIIR
ncbi:hypothetical protein FQN54_007543 [Arachnomyces sp. PD_36]|nr:hypothetical protein FQN54_007543 [Arachnomyces sp. PD_36]